MLLVLRSFSEGELVPSQAKKEILGHILLYHRAGNTTGILQEYYRNTTGILQHRANNNPTQATFKLPLFRYISSRYQTSAMQEFWD